MSNDWRNSQSTIKRSLKRTLEKGYDILMCTDTAALTSEQSEEYHEAKHMFRQCLRIVSPEFQAVLEAEVKARIAAGGDGLISPDEALDLLSQ